MGLLNRLRGKKDDTMEKVKEQTTPQPTHPTNAPAPPGRRIKRYTSEVKQSTNKYQLSWPNITSSSNCSRRALSYLLKPSPTKAL
jgi:hypothetical protein